MMPVAAAAALQDKERVVTHEDALNVAVLGQAGEGPMSTAQSSLYWLRWLGGRWATLKHCGVGMGGRMRMG